MRHNIQSCFIFFSLVINLLLASCGSEETVPEGFVVSTAQFKVISDTLRINGQATEATLTVTADCDWSIQTSGWDDLHATPDHGEGTGNVTISTSKNDYPTERKGVLVITTGSGIKKTMTLVQGPDSIRLELSPKSLSFGIDGGQTEVTVNSNTSWELTGGNDWCQASVKKGEAGITAVTIKAEKTDEKEMRTATFTVTPAGGTAQNISVKQTNKEISFSSSIENISFNATAGQEKEFEVTSNDTWMATVSDDWIEITPTTAGNTTTETTKVTVRCVEDNNTGSERRATITLNCSGVEKVIQVRQGVTDVSFAVTLGEIFTDGTGGTLSVTGNTSWTVTCGEEWCQLDGDGTGRTPHQGSGTVRMKLDANPSTEERTAHIRFDPASFDPVTVSVVQKATSIEIQLKKPDQDDNGKPELSRR